MIVNSSPQGEVASLKSVFQSVSAESCPWQYNFHLHTLYSDGQLRPESIVQQAIAHGLKGFAITDHHTVAGYQEACRWLEAWTLSHHQDGPILWSGIEITAELLGIEVHILGYGFDPAHAGIQPYLNGEHPTGTAGRADSVIQGIQQAGGLAVLAHPVRYRRSPGDLIPAAAELGIDGVEGFYCYGNLDPWSPSLKQMEQVLQLGNAHNLFQTCGTDTHGLSILKRI
ncbi:MAG: PHP domain-containing protein [Thermosynechococcaceae cyanobacterium MS004]|nr:PHP domain-containing protein [Thermosynechococcaceae cyanobacterium MS004]